MNLGHIFIILTKRPGKMKKYVQEHRNLESAICYQETSNIWFGVTAENQKRADDRIPILLEIPAAVRFVSVEPMLERVTTLSRHIDITNPRWVDWVICGAETGPGARRMRKQWAIDLYKECKCGNVPFFFKKPSKGDEIDLPREFPVEQQ